MGRTAPRSQPDEAVPAGAALPKCAVSGKRASGSCKARAAAPERGHRQADHVPVVALDAARPAPRPAPGSRSRRRAPPLAGGQVPVDVGVARGRGSDARSRRRRRARAVPRSARPPRPRACGPRALAGWRAASSRRPACRRSRPSSDDLGVRAQHQLAGDRRAPCGSAFSITSSRGSPSVSSSTSGASTANSIPSCSRIARRCGEREREDQGSAAPGRRARSRARPTRPSRSRARGWSGPRGRSRRGSSRARPRAGWWRRSPGGRPRRPRGPRARAPPAGRR